MCKMSSKTKLRKLDMNGNANAPDNAPANVPGKRIKCAACKLKVQSWLKNPSTPITVDDSVNAEHLEGDHGWGAHVIVNNSKAPVGTTAEFYRRFGYYWNYFPKTDNTYSPQSPFYKKEVAPGIPVIPNLSRRPIRSTLGSKSSFSGSLLSTSEDDSGSSSFYCTNCSSERQERDVREVKTGSVVSRVLREAYRVVVSTVTRTVTTVEEEETTSAAAAAVASANTTDMRRRAGNGGMTSLDGGDGDFSQAWTGEAMLTSTPMVRRKQSPPVSNGFSCGWCLLASFIALILLLVSSLFLFPPEEIECTNGACESLAIAEGSTWRWTEDWAGSWPQWIYPSVWWAGVSAWTASWWPSWTFLAAPNPCPKEDCKTDSAVASAVLERVEMLENYVSKRLSHLDSLIQDRDQVSSLSIETLKHRVSELKMELGELAKSGITERKQEGGDGFALDYPKKLVEYVDSAISRYHADRISLPDYALQSSGGEVVSIRCTVSHKSSTGYYTLFGIPLAAKSMSPDVILTPGTMPGDCWSFDGQTGSVVVRLSRWIRVKSITIDHAPKEILPQGNFASAPKDFSVYGLEDVNDKEPVLLGQFRFEENGGSVQHYKALEVDKPFQYVELSVHSNHGHMQYTCLYRFRVHGEPIDTGDWIGGPSL